MCNGRYDKGGHKESTNAKMKEKNNKGRKVKKKKSIMLNKLKKL